MGERFYLAQLAATGTCPGRNPKHRRHKVAWTDEKKQEAIEAYLAAKPTPETSMDIVQEVAEELEESVNGVRMILSKAQVYVKKTPKASTSTSTTGSTRVGKEAAQAALIEAITDAGAEVNEDIISKMTGKAAVYFKELVTFINA